jgi:GNAT superfamily N-acetyltransferase
MQVRPAQLAEADHAIGIVRRSIQELCELDHKNDPTTPSLRLNNKTADNMRRWIAAHTVLLAVDSERTAGVAAVRADGEVFRNYVAPEARFQGASKCLMQSIEIWASRRGIRMAQAGKLGHRNSLLSLERLDHGRTAAARFWRDREKSDAQTGDSSTGSLMSHVGYRMYTPVACKNG